MPRNTAKRPALLDPQSGFVLAEGERRQARDTAMRRMLAQHHPSAVTDALFSNFSEVYVVFQPDGNAGTLDIITESPVKVTKTYGVLSQSHKLGHRVPPAIPEPQLAAARKDRERLSDWPTLAEEYVSSAAPKDLAEFLAFHTRRLFTSPRLKAVIEERLRSGGQLTEDETEDEPEPLIPGTR
jgi:hypothetical protein